MSTKHSWLNPKLEVGKSRIHGLGEFAKANIKKGERLALFGGDIMLIDEINELPKKIRDYPMQIEERFALGSRNATGPEDH